MITAPPELGTRQPGSSSSRRGVRLSPAGRQKFGEWLANRLTVAAGGVLGLIIVPGLLKPNAIEPVALAAMAFGALALAAVGGAVHYVTAERMGEEKPKVAEKTDEC